MIIEDSVRRSLVPFADPGSEFDLKIKSDDSAEFQFQRQSNIYRGTARNTLDGSLHFEIDSLATNRRFSDLRAFLCSAEVADIQGMCRIQKNILDRDLGKKTWVDADAEIAGIADDIGRPKAGLSGIRDFIAAPDRKKTRVLVVDGKAGIGKTWLLNKICLECAEAVLDRKGGTPMLIVNSRGRRLSRLYDAIAASTQDVRARASYWEVAPLVRQGSLILAIDGFDELAYAEGYKDAWANLESLLAELDGQGTLIISARDTFFHDQELFSTFIKAQSLRPNTLQIEHLLLRPWRPKQVRLFLENHQPALGEDNLNAVLDLTLDGRMPLLERPLFVRLLAEHLANDGDIESVGYKKILIDSFVRREVDRVFSEQRDARASENARSSVDTEHVRVLSSFFKELAAEMFVQESQSLDIDTIRTYLDIYLEPLTSSEARRAIIHRASSIGFMDRITDGGRERRRFPHETVFYWFLCDYLLDEFKDRPRFESFLRRGVFSPDMRDALVESVERRIDFDIGSCVEWALRRLPEVPTQGMLRVNIGAFLMALLSSRYASELPEIAIRDEVFDSVSLAESQCRIHFERCSFNFIDASSADLSRVRFTDVRVARLHTDEYTTTGGELPVVNQLDIESVNVGLRSVRTPTQIASHLMGLRRRTAPDQPSGGERLLSVLAKLWTRKFFVDADEIRAARHYTDTGWQALLALLESHKRIRIERSYQMAGTRRTLYRLRDPVAILARRHYDQAVQDEIDAIWTEAHQIP